MNKYIYTVIIVFFLNVPWGSGGGSSNSENILNETRFNKIKKVLINWMSNSCKLKEYGVNTQSEIKAIKKIEYSKVHNFRNYFSFSCWTYTYKNKRLDGIYLFPAKIGYTGIRVVLIIKEGKVVKADIEKGYADLHWPIN